MSSKTERFYTIGLSIALVILIGFNWYINYQLTETEMMYRYVSGQNTELREQIIDLKNQSRFENYNLTIELAREQGRNENLLMAFNSILEESRKQSQWIEDVSSTYFDMRTEMQEYRFQLQLCRYGVESWEEYVENKFGIGYVENNP